jgi:hypothetical protein
VRPSRRIFAIILNVTWRIEAGERLLKDLAERDFSKLAILAVWIDGSQLGSYHVICAVGVDSEGHKHVLGLR